MKFISLENQVNNEKTLIKIDLIKKIYIEKHDNPESNRLILSIYEYGHDFGIIHESSNFDYEKFVSFLEQIDEGNVEIFKIDVMKTCRV